MNITFFSKKTTNGRKKTNKKRTNVAKQTRAVSKVKFQSLYFSKYI